MSKSSRNIAKFTDQELIRFGQLLRAQTGGTYSDRMRRANILFRDEHKFGVPMNSYGYTELARVFPELLLSQNGPETCVTAWRKAKEVKKPRPGSGLSPAQTKAMTLLLKGHSQTDAARKAGLNATSIGSLIQKWERVTGQKFAAPLSRPEAIRAGVRKASKARQQKSSVHGRRPLPARKILR